jgi:tRNA1(Val) A37 N6-methylase TrmN6
MWLDEPKIAAAFKSGKGVGWHQHSACLFKGTERFFRPGYNANLISSWIPALDGVEAKLKKGATVADVGCGHGASTILMAQAFPKSQFFGFDYHADFTAANIAPAMLLLPAPLRPLIHDHNGSRNRFPRRHL